MCSAFHVMFHYFRSKMEDHVSSYGFIREFNSSISSRHLQSVNDGQYVTYIWIFFVSLVCQLLHPGEFVAEIILQNLITVVYGEYSNRSDHLVCRCTPLIHMQFKWHFSNTMCAKIYLLSYYFPSNIIETTAIYELYMSWCRFDWISHWS